MIIVFIVVLGIVLSISFVYMDHLEARKRNAALFYQFSKLGSRYGMSFTSQEMLAQRIIGLDAIMQKILVFEIQDNEFDWYLINLKEVKRCTVKRVYGRIDADAFDKKHIEDYLEMIALEFYFKDNQRSVALPFYIKLQNAPEEIPELENKAKDWEVILGKMLFREVKRA
ncbi:hypothetical protein SY85_10450 [Flavisolibacter tropicus]|uniref:Uncharacterized protein n=2 Tax=Flavisolibacter tropicus TaxID=1492898 RepID=A0A172TUZ5_9BACT|nr:hypothetical protein SY85_10450 [Flavisolibacter tropicus]